MEQNEQIQVGNAMESYGGSFVAALGKALLRADSENAQKIKIAFPEDWKKYNEMANADATRSQG